VVYTVDDVLPIERWGRFMLHLKIILMVVAVVIGCVLCYTLVSDPDIFTVKKVGVLDEVFVSECGGVVLVIDGKAFYCEFFATRLEVVEGRLGERVLLHNEHGHWWLERWR